MSGETNHIFIILLALLTLVLIALRIMPLGLWLSARASGVRISVFKLMAMRRRKISLDTLVSAMVINKKADLGLDSAQFEKHIEAGGNIEKVVYAMTLAKSNNIELDFEQAREIDLEGRDVLKEIQLAVKSKNTAYPDSEKINLT